MFLRGKIKNYIGHANRFRVVGMASASILTLIAAFLVFPIVKVNDDVEGAHVPSDPPTILITSTSEIASVEVIPTSSTGSFATSTAAQEIAFTVSTNNLTGYDLKIAGTDDTRQLVGTVTSETIDSISAATDAGTFANGSAATYNNKWGYKPSMYNSVSNSNFLRAPTTAGETLNKTTTANAAGTANSYTIGVGARIDPTVLADEYTNTFNLIAVGNPISYQIRYYDNTTLISTDAESDITASSFILSSTVPTKTDYDFVGWCDGTVNYAANPMTCSGTVYQPGATYNFASIPSVGTATADLYAMWGEKMKTMQEFSDEDVTNMAEGSTSALLDDRDNQQYTILKYDGVVYTTRNLALGCDGYGLNYGSNRKQVTLTSADSNLTTTTTRGTAALNTSTGEGVQCDSTYGAYYGYYEATAGITVGSTTAPTEDICPKGWRAAIPQAHTYNRSGFLNAFSPVAGLDNPSSRYYTPDASGTYGVWWNSASTSSSRYISSLVYNGSNLTTFSVQKMDYSNIYGSAAYVRCMKSQYLQDFTPTQAAGMSTGDIYYLRDKRDDQQYSIVKLADGKVWMGSTLKLSNTLNTASGWKVTQLDSTNTNLTGDNANKVIDQSTFIGWWHSGNNTAQTYTDGVYKAGGLYNYYAATAGTVESSSNWHNATSDICPKGWRLPTGGAPGNVSSDLEFLTSISRYDTPDEISGYITSGGAGFVFTGYFGAAGVVNDTTNGFYWSSTMGSATAAYDLTVTASTFAIGSSRARNRGEAVRCVFESRTIADIAYMQDVNPLIANNTPEGASATLTDARGGKTYTVKKIDGKLWMTQNLQFEGTPIKNLDTNINSASKAITWRPYDGAYCKNNYAYTQFCKVAGVDNNGDPTVWYNYVAATGGTVTGTSNYDDAEYDICPKGWRLLKPSEQVRLIEGSYMTEAYFNPVAGGYYNGGDFWPDNSYYWSSRSSGYWDGAVHSCSDTGRISIEIDSAAPSISATCMGRNAEAYVRCVSI